MSEIERHPAHPTQPVHRIHGRMAASEEDLREFLGLVAADLRARLADEQA